MAQVIASPQINLKMNTANFVKGITSTRNLWRQGWRNINRITRRGSERNASALGRGLSLSRIILGGFLSFVLVSIIGKMVSAFQRAFTEIPKFVLKAGSELESGLVAIQKTTGFTADETEELRQRFIALSRKIPLSTKQLTKIAAAAGRMGVALDESGKKAGDAVDRIFDFSVSVAKADSAIEELETERLALGIGRLIKLFKLNANEAKNLTSSINSVAEASATGADSILNITERSAAAFKAIGFTADQAIGLSAAISALGRRSEVAATSLERIIVSLVTPEGAAKFARFLGLTKREFQEIVEENPEKALLDVLRAFEGLTKTKAEEALRKLFGANVRIAGSARVLTQNIGEITKNLRIAREEFKKGTSVEIEFNKVAATTAEQMKLVGQIFDSIGAELFPKIRSGVFALIDAFKAFGFSLLEVTRDENFISFINETLRDLALLGSSIGKFITKFLGAFFKSFEKGPDVGFLRTLSSVIDNITDAISPESIGFFVKQLKLGLTAVLLIAGTFANIARAILLAADFIDRWMMSLGLVKGFFDDIIERANDLKGFFDKLFTIDAAKIKALKDVFLSLGDVLSTVIGKALGLATQKQLDAALLRFGSAITKLIPKAEKKAVESPAPEVKRAKTKEAKETVKKETEEEERRRPRGQIIIPSALAKDILKGIREERSRQFIFAKNMGETAGEALAKTLKESARREERPTILEDPTRAIRAGIKEARLTAGDEETRRAVEDLQDELLERQINQQIREIEIRKSVEKLFRSMKENLEASEAELAAAAAATIASGDLLNGATKLNQSLRGQKSFSARR